MRRLFNCFSALLLFFTSFLFSNESFNAIEPIDVIIPAVEKDQETLDYCIDSIRKNVIGIRRIIIISKKKLTNKAEWFSEDLYPFNFTSIGKVIFEQDEEKANWFASDCPRKGWILQQLLKLYAPFVIPGISSNVLAVDSDVIFLRPQTFITNEGSPLFAYGKEHRKPYFEHMQRLLPNLKRVYRDKSGICHHMLFQRSILEKLFDDIRALHQVEPWIAICKCINKSELLYSSFSEYEIYFNYVFLKGFKAELRPLKWCNSKNLTNEFIKSCLKQKYDYIAFHKWMR